MSELSGIITAPRWARVPTALKNICFERDLACEVDVDKGWISETVRFKVTGDKQSITALRWAIESTIKECGGTIRGHNEH